MWGKADIITLGLQRMGREVIRTATMGGYL